MTDHEYLIRRLETPYPAGRWMSNGTTVDPACRDAATTIKELVEERDHQIEMAEDNAQWARRERDRAEKAERECVRLGFVVDAQVRRAEKAEADLGNLLAIIHRDGGHYQAEHGTEKSVETAHVIWGGY